MREQRNIRFWGSTLGICPDSSPFDSSEHAGRSLFPAAVASAPRQWPELCLGMWSVLPWWSALPCLVPAWFIPPSSPGPSCHPLASLELGRACLDLCAGQGSGGTVLPSAAKASQGLHLWQPEPPVAFCCPHEAPKWP